MLGRQVTPLFSIYDGFVETQLHWTSKNPCPPSYRRVHGSGGDWDGDIYSPTRNQKPHVQLHSIPSRLRVKKKKIYSAGLNFLRTKANT